MFRKRLLPFSLTFCEGVFLKILGRGVGVLGLDGSRQLLAKAGYGAMTLGDHDFDRGTDVLKDWV